MAVFSRTLTKYREVHREYLAIARGFCHTFRRNHQAPLGRKEGTIIERTVDWEHGEDAVTHYKVVKEANGHSLVSLRLETGRTLPDPYSYEISRLSTDW